MNHTSWRPGALLFGSLFFVLKCRVVAWTSPTITPMKRLGVEIAAVGSEEGEPDLFDYFDPLLSPHAYPNGISPKNKPDTINDSVPLYVNHEDPTQQQAQQKPPMPDPLVSPQRPSVESSPGTMHAEYLERKLQMERMEEKAQESPADQGEPDLLDFFDPLLSPHAYPNGISPDQKPQTKNIHQKTESSEAIPSYNPLEIIKPPPLSSPSPSRLGVLLMDHGSRNEASNNRLIDLAKLYQQTLALDGGKHVVVEAAHMEIAKPSIPDGLQALLDQGVDEIVCHPYFLSPGRHVREDIPEIVESAIADMKIQIPVRTTDPVGSNTQLMIGAIHSLVRETSAVLREE